jgi:pimeloyl-ACP methyl ester carboxylesterase
MRALLALLAGLCAFAFAALAVSMALRQNWGGTLIFAAFATLCVPGLGRLLTRATGLPFPALARGGAFLIVTGLLLWWLSGAPRPSIYNSPAVAARFERLYAQKLAAWPVPYESRFLDTRLGRVHVIVSGPQEAPPMLLLHASAVSSWSWIYNIEGLSQDWRVYAVDLIGDAGLSAYADLGNRMNTPADEADHYAEVMDLLGLPRASVVGASEGGFIALNLALRHPERVERLVLLGPMGLSGTIGAAARITLAQLFPVRPLQAATFRWAFSDNAKLQADFGEWFPLVMSGTLPAKVAPWPLSAEARRAMSRPALFVFGTRDNVVGDPEAARARAADFPDARVEVVEAGHLMAAEAPDEINALILGFLGEGGP